jgi:hypothetical protein
MGTLEICGHSASVAAGSSLDLTNSTDWAVYVPLNDPVVNSITATTLYGSLDTNVAAAGLTISGTTITADGTDANIDITLVTKGIGTVILDMIKSPAGSGLHFATSTTGDIYLEEDTHVYGVLKPAQTMTFETAAKSEINSAASQILSLNAKSNFEVITNALKRFEITSATGIQHFPYASRFAARTSVGRTVATTFGEIIFEIEEFDQQSEYDNTTGFFTADEDGTYTFNWGVHLVATVAWTLGDEFATQLVVDPSTTRVIKALNVWEAPAAATYRAPGSVGSVTVELSAGDEVVVEAKCDQGPKFTETTAAMNWFSCVKNA